jgi:conjugative relaxase-like TrwC/TraI family protein
MMSLWKLRVGVESYYLAQIASGLDEYYTGAGEAAGRWTGTASTLLGLDGHVAGDDLRAVLAGLAPGSGLTPNGARLRSHPRRVPGFDLTFAVPKSVSTVYALGDPLVQAAVIAACETALGEALSWLEREACFVRRGTNNRRMASDPAGFGTRRMIGEGFVAAQFPHRTSRVGDPHLHWHVLVANMARGIDGRWSALEGTALYRAQRTVGVLFQTVMRRELSLRLGVEWGPIHADSAEIAGVPTRVLREFSQRHEQIAEWLDTTGLSGPQATGQALVETRTSKHELDDFATLEAAWRT